MVTVLMRAYFSSHHYWAAKHYTRLAMEIEEDHTGEPRFDINHRSYVSSAILSSVAFMEASINELFKDVVDGHESYISPISGNVRSLMASFWSHTEDQNRSALGVVDRYQLVLNFAGIDMFAKGQQPYQDARLLVNLRNYLVHYKPEHVSRSGEHRLERQLRGKFQENRMLPDNPFIPDRCLGVGCSQWAVSSSENYVGKFYELIGIVPNYRRVDFDKSG